MRSSLLSLVQCAYMSGSIEMENTYTPEQEVGVVQWILGKSVSSVVLRNTGLNDGCVGIAAPSLARILPVDLAMFGGDILCQVELTNQNRFPWLRLSLALCQPNRSWIAFLAGIASGNSHAAEYQKASRLQT